MKFKVWSVQCEEWRVECRSVKCGCECNVWSVESNFTKCLACHSKRHDHVF